MPKRTYLDANAGVPLLREVRSAVAAAFETAANGSSVHSEGRKARALIENARGAVAASVGARPDSVVFTSGATEAAATALSPRWSRGANAVRFSRLYVAATEHPCVLAGGRFDPERIVQLPVDASGVLDLAVLQRALATHDKVGGPPLVAVMLANNETGVVQLIGEIAAIVHAHGGALVCDAVQALGRIPVGIYGLGADVLLLSAHKLGGPQGAGAMIVADPDFRPEPLVRGGGQEQGRRSGTENVTAIVGFGVAALAAEHHLEHAGRLALLRDRLEAGILLATPEARVASAGVGRLPNTTLVIVPGIAAETTVIALDLEGVAVSAGSACSSGKASASHVLRAMGERPDVAQSGIRISLPPDAAEADVVTFLAAWRVVHSRIARSRAA